MSLRNLPKLEAPALPSGYRGEPPSRALKAWAERPLAAEADDTATISIYEHIGEDPFDGSGVSSRRVAGALRSIGKRDVTVNINSPGGFADEGVAIYNLLAEHPGRVTVKVMGIAASAASIVAMAGDEVLMGRGTILMVHNGWGLVIGNRHDFRNAADIFETFDRSMAGIYAARTGASEEDMLAIMDGEGRGADGTWMTPAEAIALGFADGEFEADKSSANAKTETVPAHVASRRQLEAALSQAGVPRSERAAMLEEFLAAQRDASGPSARDAGDLTTADLEAAIATLRVA